MFKDKLLSFFNKPIHLNFGRKPRIAILGVRGMLGSMVAKYLYHEGYPLDVYARFNVSELDDLIYPSDVRLYPINIAYPPLQLQDVKYVINCIGVIKPCIKNEKMAYEVNSNWPARLADLINGKLIHISTDCCYSGRSYSAYNEFSICDADDIYGKSKVRGDHRLQLANNKNAMILRTSIIGLESRHKRSLLSWVFKQDGKRVNGFFNHFWQGVTTLQLAKVIEQIIRKNLFKHGVQHVFSPESISKYALIQLISDTYNLNIDLHLTEAPDRCNRALSTIDLNYLAKFKIPPIDQQLKEAKDVWPW